MFRNKKVIKNLASRLPELLDIESKVNGLAGLAGELVCITSVGSQAVPSLEIRGYSNKDLILKSVDSYLLEAYPYLNISQREFIHVDGIKCFVFARVVLTNEYDTDTLEHEEEGVYRVGRAFCDVITEYNDYYKLVDDNKFKKMKLKDLYDFVEGDHDTMSDLKAQMDHSVRYGHLTLDTDKGLYQVMLSRNTYVGYAIDDQNPNVLFYNLYEKVPFRRFLRNGEPYNQESSKKIVQLQNAPVSKNKNQKELERLISKYKLGPKIDKLYGKQDSEISFVNFNDSGFYILSKLDEETSLILRYECAGHRVEVETEDSYGGFVYVVDYIAFLGNFGVYEATRNRAGYLLAKAPSAGLAQFYDYSLYLEKTLEGFRDITRLGYVSSILETLDDKEKVPFILGMYEGLYIESLLKGPLSLQATVMLKTLNLGIHRSVTNRISSYYGQIVDTEASLPKALGLTSAQLESVKDRYGYLVFPYPYWLKKLIKPEGFEGVDYSSHRGYSQSRRSPANEKFVSITDISDNIYVELLDKLEDIVRYGSQNVNSVSVETIGELLHYISMSGMSHQKIIRTLEFLVDILRYKVKLTNSGSLTIEFDHYKDYFKLIDETKSLLAEQGISYDVFCIESHIIEDRFKNLSEIRDAKKAALQLEMFEGRYESKWSKLEYSSGDLSIIAPQHPNELTSEGSALNHCVAGYRDRAATGKTNILFIRDKNNMDKPLYTIEINNSNRVVQVRGHSNATPTLEVNEFVEEYTKQKLR